MAGLHGLDASEIAFLLRLMEQNTPSSPSDAEMTSKICGVLKREVRRMATPDRSAPGNLASDASDGAETLVGNSDAEADASGLAQTGTGAGAAPGNKRKAVDVDSSEGAPRRKSARIQAAVAAAPAPVGGGDGGGGSGKYPRGDSKKKAAVRNLYRGTGASDVRALAEVEDGNEPGEWDDETPMSDEEADADSEAERQQPKKKGKKGTKKVTVDGVKKVRGSWKACKAYVKPSQQASRFIIETALGCFSRTEAIFSLADAIRDGVRCDFTTATRPKTLDEAIVGCKRLEGLKAVAAFHAIMAYVNVALHIDLRKRMHYKHHKTILSTKEIARENGNVAETTLNNWNARGLKLLTVAHAGTCYMLMLVAALQQQHWFGYHDKLTVEDVQSLSWSLRTVHDGKEGAILSGMILPLVRSMITKKAGGDAATLHMPQEDGSFVEIPFWQVDELEGCAAGGVLATDRALEIVATRGFRLPARCPDWLQEVTPGARRERPEPKVERIQSVKLGYRACGHPDLLKGKCLRWRKRWTERKRVETEKAEKAESADGLKQKLEADVGPDENGRRAGDSFVRVCLSDLDRDGLLVRDSEGALAAFLVQLESADPVLLESIGVASRMLLDGNFTVDETNRAGLEFVAYHFQIYNRYGKGGENAPRHIHPCNITVGHGNRRDNIDQRLPYASKDIQVDPERHSYLSEMMAPIFEEIAEKVGRHMPEEKLKMSLYVSRLPLDRCSPADPYSGWVFNVEVSTDGHRDKGDVAHCCVLTLGNYGGGELVLYELGLVVDLRPGQALFFPSTEITHFNLGYRGWRYSIVLSCDKMGMRWVDKENGWGHALAGAVDDDLAWSDVESEDEGAEAGDEGEGEGDGGSGAGGA